MDNPGFDIAVVNLNTLVLKPGQRLRLILSSDALDGEHMLLDISSPRFLTNDDGSQGNLNTDLIWLIQFGSDLKPFVERRLKQNEIHFVYLEDGKIELKVEPKNEK